jgi:hypothetical protein
MGHQIVSKQRVADHGEVLTSEREVKAMLDLVKQETERIESRFLEPACGTGNLLAEVLERKLAAVTTRYRRSQLDYERHAMIALGSLYGIDILKDNVDACRERLFAIFDRAYTERFKEATTEACRRSARFILERNIIWGDALSLRTVDDEPRPIVFSEWSLARGSKLKRRDYAFKELIDHQAIKAMPLFSDLGEQVFIPTPLREYPLTHYLEIADVD